MRERPILFSGPMVRAILDDRKTKTRRVIKCPSDTKAIYWLDNSDTVPKGRYTGWVIECGAPLLLPISCPYGIPGDRLWVRETWRVVGGGADCPIRELSQAYSNCLQFRADRDESYIDKYHPSIFMPRWASRITLEIVSVRVERLQEISKGDAIAEGIESEHSWDGQPGFGYDMGMWYRDYSSPATSAMIQSPIDSYKSLWDSINRKKYPWSSNPRVWVIEFKRIK